MSNAVKIGAIIVFNFLFLFSVGLSAKWYKEFTRRLQIAVQLKQRDVVVFVSCIGKVIASSSYVKLLNHTMYSTL